MEPWSKDFLRERQSVDNDIRIVRGWLEDNQRPDWSLMRGHSPSLKAYWMQYESLCLIDGLVYRQLELLHGELEPQRQFLLPYPLRESFLRSIYEGISGHLGVA